MLSNPVQRAFVESYTRRMTDPVWVDRAWVRLEINEKRDFCFDDVIHLFFDDTQYAKRPEIYLGKSLFDGEEVAAVRRIVAAIDVLLEAEGERALTDAEYLQMPEWGEVHEAAKALHALIVANDAAVAGS